MAYLKTSSLHFAAHNDPAEMEFNKDMSSIRVSVEWTFGKITQLFAFPDIKKKLPLQQVAKYY